MLTFLAASALFVASDMVPEGADVMESGSWTFRVGGESEGPLVTREGDEGPLYRAGKCMTDTKLPVGYPAPTPPGAIELKHYASVRRAEFTSDSSNGMNGFWPLFQHIQRNDIAMTAPVEMEMEDVDNDGQADEYTMTFLYHTPEDGPVGEDGDIEIVDTEPTTWLAIGVRGRSQSAMEQAVRELDESLAEQDEWVRVGEPRTLGYNGPNVAWDRQWWEVQVRVVRGDGSDDPEG